MLFARPLGWLGGGTALGIFSSQVAREEEGGGPVLLWRCLQPSFPACGPSLPPSIAKPRAVRAPPILSDCKIATTAAALPSLPRSLDGPLFVFGQRWRGIDCHTIDSVRHDDAGAKPDPPRGEGAAAARVRPRRLTRKEGILALRARTALERSKWAIEECAHFRSASSVRGARRG